MATRVGAQKITKIWSETLIRRRAVQEKHRYIIGLPRPCLQLASLQQPIILFHPVQHPLDTAIHHHPLLYISLSFTLLRSFRIGCRFPLTYYSPTNRCHPFALRCSPLYRSVLNDIPYTTVTYLSHEPMTPLQVDSTNLL